jgi:probable rRNA maturation factor
MITVLVYIESRFPLSRDEIRIFVQSYLSPKFTSSVEVNVSIVGDRKMKALNSFYRNLDETTDVLSFPISDPSTSSRRDFEVGFSPDKSAPDGSLRLGDVVVSYPQAVEEAAAENKLVSSQLEFLIAHGLDHLLGKHHPE